MLARIDELHQAGSTIVSITHFMGEAARAERVIVLSYGRVALDGPPAEVFSDPQRLFALGADRFLVSLTRLYGISNLELTWL